MRVAISLRSESGRNEVSVITLTNVTNITHNQTENILSFLHRSEVMAQLYFPDIISIRVEQNRKEDAKP